MWVWPALLGPVEDTIFDISLQLRYAKVIWWKVRLRSYVGSGGTEQSIGASKNPRRTALPMTPALGVQTVCSRSHGGCMGG